MVLKVSGSGLYVLFSIAEIVNRDTSTQLYVGARHRTCHEPPAVDRYTGQWPAMHWSLVDIVASTYAVYYSNLDQLIMASAGIND